MINPFLRDLVASVPFIQFWILVLIFRRRLTLTSNLKLWTMFFVSLLWFPFYKMGYTYEAILFIEAGMYFWLGWIYVRQYLYVKPLLLISFALILFAWMSHDKGVQYQEWIYPSGTKYLLGYITGSIGPGGLVTSTPLWFGADMPRVEKVWYIVSIGQLISQWYMLRWILPKEKWETPVRRLRYLWISIFPVISAILLLGSILFFIKNGHICVLATIANIDYILFIIGWISLKDIRDLASTKLFAAYTLYGFFNFMYWEFLHSSVMDHWHYVKENDLGSVFPWWDVYFPEISAIGSSPVFYPLEEPAAYWGVMTIMPVLFRLFKPIFGKKLFKDDTLLP